MKSHGGQRKWYRTCNTEGKNDNLEVPVQQKQPLGIKRKEDFLRCRRTKRERVTSPPTPNERLKDALETARALIKESRDSRKEEKGKAGVNTVNCPLEVFENKCRGPQGVRDGSSSPRGNHCNCGGGEGGLEGTPPPQGVAPARLHQHPPRRQAQTAVPRIRTSRGGSPGSV